MRLWWCRRRYKPSAMSSNMNKQKRSRKISWVFIIDLIFGFFLSCVYVWFRHTKRYGDITAGRNFLKFRSSTWPPFKVSATTKIRQCREYCLPTCLSVVYRFGFGRFCFVWTNLLVDIALGNQVRAVAHTKLTVQNTRTAASSSSLSARDNRPPPPRNNVVSTNSPAW